MCRPTGTLDMSDTEAVEGALADASNVAAVVLSGANFGQAEQVTSFHSTFSGSAGSVCILVLWDVDCGYQ